MITIWIPKKLLTNSIVSLSIKCKLLSLGMSIRLSGARYDHHLDTKETVDQLDCITQYQVQATCPRNVNQVIWDKM
ncbi:hypothetical protein J6590_087276 [Homalodisca vitripennis]|nr:hypothetical protein J6590_087276 [Homalodisca vitripennis]